MPLEVGPSEVATLSIGDVLRDRRKQLSLTITAVARCAGVPRPYLSMVESGRRSPSPKALLRLVGSLGLTSDMWLPVWANGERRSGQLLEVGRVLFEQGDYVAARLALGRALIISRRNGESRCASDVHHVLGMLYFLQGRYTRARLCFERREHSARHASDPLMLGFATCNLGLTLGRIGQDVEAIRKLDESIRIFGQLHMRADRGRAWLAKADSLLALRMYPQAHQSYRRAGHLLRGNPLHAEAALGVAITTLVVRGPDSALPMLQAIPHREATDQVVYARALGYKSVALRWLGRYDDALHEVEQVLSARERLPAGLVAGILTEAALCHTFKGDLEQARRMLDEYRVMGHQGDGSDIAVMNILAEILSVEPPDAPIPPKVRDGHELRLTAALRLLRDTPTLPRSQGVK